MAERGHPIPDAEALARLLAAHDCDPAGLVLRLAWRAGLNREEIAALTWAQADLGAPALRLPDREIPLDAETAAFLRRWARQRGKSEYVAVSARRRRLSPASMSMLARKALDAAGIGDVSLRDLRRDFARRQFAENDWPRALRVTGLALSTCRGSKLAAEERPPAANAPAPPAQSEASPSGAEARPGKRPPPPSGAEDEYKLWRILQTERDTPAGLALWLTSQLGLTLEEIAALTWAQVDFAADTLRLPRRAVPLTAGTRRVLEDLRARRAPGDDPHVLLSVRSRRPVGAKRLTSLIRETLIRGGIEGKTAVDFRKRKYK